eukprot:CAMPEP_0179068542 /NCGR_PEP_ID=MMETSP0796-20121207/30053_1 /TAXON_ID=73915 /ORGANISM="Pyrodinium bahamense, Strain pbaha01" /LENGTH=148 /DNA_ID=CAMNT_0020765595 /DNA_START=375 /DNA_END=817 /DNA_ORIENTATION=-
MEDRLLSWCGRPRGNHASLAGNVSLAAAAATLSPNLAGIQEVALACLEDAAVTAVAISIDGRGSNAPGWLPLRRICQPRSFPQASCQFLWRFNCPVRSTTIGPWVAEGGMHPSTAGATTAARGSGTTRKRGAHALSADLSASFNGSLA